MKLATLALLLFLSAPTWAEPPRGEGPPPMDIPGQEGPEKVFLQKRRPPPIEAIEACEKKKRNAACNYLGKRGEDAVRIEGYCWAPEPSLPLACRPEEGAAPPPPQKKKQD